MEKSKKLAPIYIMDILKRYSSEEDPLLHSEVERQYACGGGAR